MITAALNTFATGSYALVRRAAATYDVDGKVVEGAAVLTTSFRAVVVPMSGRELLALPEGQRTEEGRKIGTTFALQTRTPTTEPDEVTIDGDVWVVSTVSRVQFCGETFYEATAARRSPL